MKNANVINSKRRTPKTASSLEILEGRIAPASVVSLSTGNLLVNDGANGADTIIISVSGANYHFADVGGITAGSGASQIDGNNVEVSIASVTGSFTVATNGGNDSVTFSTALSTPGDLTVEAGVDSLTVNGALTAGGNVTLGSTFDVNVNANISKSGAAAATLTIRAFNDIFFNSSADVGVSGSGVFNVVLNADRDANNSGKIFLNSGTVIDSNGGSITLGGGTNPLTMPAVGGSVGNDNHGIRLDGAQLISGAGAISLRGQGGSVITGETNMGVQLLNNALIQTSTGGITIFGTGGTGSGTIDNHVGVSVQNGSDIVSTGSGAITITGVAGAGSSRGISVEGAGSTINSQGTGAISLFGTGGTGAIEIGGFSMKDSGAVLAGGGASILIEVDSVSSADSFVLINTAGTISGTGTLTIRPASNVTTIGIGASATGVLNLDTTDLSKLADGFSGITIGRTTGTGAADVNASTFNDNVTILAGSMYVTDLNAGTNNVTLTTLSGPIGNGGDAGPDVIGGTVTLLKQGSGLTADFYGIGGVNPAAPADDYLSVDATTLSATAQRGSIAIRSSGTGGVSMSFSQTNTFGTGNIFVTSLTEDVTVTSSANAATASFYGSATGHNLSISNVSIVGASLISLVTTTSGNITIGSSASNSGALNINSAGNIVINGVITATANSTWAAGGSITGSGNVTYSGTSTLGVTSTSGGVNLTGVVTVAGATTIAAGAANDITLSNASNDFASIGITVGRNVSLADVNALTLNASTISGTLGVTAAGITVGAALSLAGDATLTSSTGVTFNNEVTMAVNKNLTATANGTGAGISLANANADLAASGTGAISLTTARDIVFVSGASIATVDGNLTLSANAAGTNATMLDGIDVNAGTVQVSGSGNLTLTGKGGVGGGSTANPAGVVVRGGGIVSGGTSGTVSVTGTGGNGTSAGDGVQNLVGVSVQESGSRITSAGANVQVTGIGGTSSGLSAGGVLVITGTISAGGTGSVTVSGTGGSGTGFNYGVDVVSGGTITSTNGAVQVTGAGGAGGADNWGVFAQVGGIITSGGTNPVSVTGTGGTGTGTEHGVVVRINSGGNGLITSGGGNVTVTGTPGASGTGNLGIQVLAGGSITTATNGGNVTLIADKIDLQNTVSTNAAGTVTLRQNTNTTAINLGSAVDTTASTLELSDTELDFATGGTLQIGDANSGAITVSAAITHGNNLTLTTGAGLSGSGALTLAAAKNLSLAANGAISLSGAITVPGTTTGAAGAVNDITLTNAGNNFGTVSITSGATISLRDDGGFNLGTNTISTALIVESAGMITQSSAITGAISLTKLGAGTLVLTSTNTFSGTTTISAGILQVGNGGTTGSLNANGAIVDNGSLVFFRGDTSGASVQDIAGAISGSGSVTYKGTGVSDQGDFQIINNASSYTGGTFIDQARVVPGNDAAFATGTITVSTGSTLYLRTANITVSNAITLNGNGWIEPAGQVGAIRFEGLNSSVAGAVTLGSNARITTLSASNPGVISGAISGAFALEVGFNGFTNGTITLSGANTYTGATAVTAGKLLVNGSLASGSAVTVAGTLGGTGTVNGTVTLTGSGTLAPGVSPGILSTGNVSFGGGAGPLTVSSYIYETGTPDPINLDSTGTELTDGVFAPNTSFGNPEFIGSRDNAPDDGVGQPGLRFDLGASYALGTVAIRYLHSTSQAGGTITAPESALISTSMDGITFTTPVSYTAEFSSAAGDAIRTATLSLTGMSGRYVRVDVRNNGQWTFLDEVSFTGGAAGGTFNAEVNGLTPGGGHDQLNVTGTVNLSNATLVTAGSIATLGTVVLIENDGSDAVTGTFSGLAQGASVTINGRSFVISYTGGSGNDVVLSAPNETDVALSGGNLVVTDINGGTSNDTLTVKINGSNVRVNDPNNLLGAGAGATQVDANTVDVPLASISGNIQFNTLAGDDSLTVDLSGGNFSKAITFTGGAGTGDALVLTGGGTFATAAFTYTSANNGSVAIAGNSTITYTGVEPISSALAVTAVTLNYPTAVDTITVGDGGAAGKTNVAAALGNSTTFTNPTGTLTINGGGLNDTINVQGVGSGFGAALTISGGAGTDTINFQTNPTSIGGLLTTTLAENVNFSAGVTSAGLTTDATAINVSATVNHGAVNATFSGAGTLTGSGAITNTGGVLRLTGNGFTTNFSGTVDDLQLGLPDNQTLTLTQSLNVSDTLLIPAASINVINGPGLLKVSGSVTVNDTTWSGNTFISLVGTSAQTLSGTGAIYNLNVNQTGGGSVVLANDFQIAQQLTGAGTIGGVGNTQFLVFANPFGGPESADFSGTIEDVKIAMADNQTLTLTQHLNVSDTLLIPAASINVINGPGLLKVSGNVTVNDTTWSGNTFISLVGTSAQTLTGAGAIYNLNVNQTGAGSVVLANDFTIAQQLTGAGTIGGVSNTQFLVFANPFGGAESADFSGTIEDVKIAMADNQILTLTQHLNVSDTLNIPAASINVINGPGLLKVSGNVTVNDTTWSGNTFISLVGTTAQTLTGAGAIYNLNVNQTGGGSVVLANDFNIAAQLTGAGTIAGANHTELLVFANPFGDAESANFSGVVEDVKIAMADNQTLTLTQHLNVSDTLLIPAASINVINGPGLLKVSGNVTLNDTTWSGNTFISLVGTTAQTLTGTGAIYNLNVNQTGGGSVVLANDFTIAQQLTGAGTIGGVGNTQFLVFANPFGNAESADFSGTIEDVKIAMADNQTLTLTHHLNVSDTLLIPAASINGINGPGLLKVSGNVTVNDTTWSGNTFISLVGTSAQTLAGTGAIYNLNVNQTGGGSVVLANDFTIAAQLTGAGTIGGANHTEKLVFANPFGNAETANFGGTIEDVKIALADNQILTLTQNLAVSDTLLITTVNSITGSGGVRQIRVAGNVTSTDTTGYTNSSSAIVLTGSSANSFTGPGSGTQGALVIDKTGTADAAQLGANATFSAVTVTRGLLDLNGKTATAPFTVSTGGTLTGAGTISGTVAVSSGTIAPGVTTGVLNTGNVTFSGTSAFNVDLNGPTLGTEYDRLNVTGTVNLGGATLHATVGFAPANGTTLVIVNNDGADAITGTFKDGLGASIPEGGTFTDGGNTFIVSYLGVLGTGNDVVLTVQNPASLTAAVTAGNLVLTDGTGVRNDNLTVTLNGANVRITDAGNGLIAGAGATQVNSTTVDVPLASITGNIVFDAQGGNDTLTLDFDNGDFIPNNLSFTAGSGTDALAITGGTQGTVIYGLASAGAGSVSMSAYGFVSYTGAESVSNSGQQDTVVLSLPGNADLAIIEDDAIAGNGLSKIRSSAGAPTFVPTTFAAPAVALNVNLGGSANVFTLASLDSQFAASLTIDGPANNNSVTVATSLALGSATSFGNLSINAETIALDSASIATNAGPNSGGITFGGNVILGSSLVLNTDSAAGNDGPITWSGTLNADSAGNLRNLTVLAGATSVNMPVVIGALAKLDNLTIEGGLVLLGAISLDGAFTATSSGSLFLPGIITANSATLVAGSLNPSGGINVGAGTVSIHPFIAGTGIDLGGLGGLGGFVLNDASLDLINAGTLFIGDNDTGNITVSAPITRAVATDLFFTAGSASLTFTGTGSINTGGGSLFITLASAGPGAITSGTAATDIICDTLNLSSGTGGIGASGNPLRFDANFLGTQSFGGNQFLSEKNTVSIHASDLSAGTGAINFVGGTFTATAFGHINPTSSVTVTGSSTTLNLAGFAQTLATLNGTGHVELAGAALTLGGGSFTGLLTGAGSLTKVGPGTLAISNPNNTFGPGPITISDGVLEVKNNGALGNLGNNLVIDSATSVLRTTGTFSTDRELTINSPTGTVEVAAGKLTFNGSIDGAGSLIKTGAAQLFFGDTVTGQVMVDTGSFTVSGTKLTVTGTGDINVTVVAAPGGGTLIDEVEFIATDSNTRFSIAGPKVGTTTINRIISMDPNNEIGSITVGKTVIIGDGVDDGIADIDIRGRVGKLNLNDLNSYTIISLGKGLPYNNAGDDTTPDSYNNHPDIKLRSILGPGVIIDVLGDGTPGGVGGGGLGKVAIDSWAFPGIIRTTQSIASFLLKTGNCLVTFEVDKLHNGALTVAGMGKVTIPNGAWGSSGSEIEGGIGAFSAKEFLATADLSAASIKKFTCKKGPFAGQMVFKDTDDSALGSVVVKGNFTGFISAAGPLKNVAVSGDFTGSLLAKSIGSISAYSLNGTTTNDNAIFGDPLRQNIIALGGSIGTIKTSAGGVSNYEIVSTTLVNGFAIRQVSALVDTIGLDHVYVSAPAIGNTSISLASPTGAILTGIQNSVFNSQGTIGNVTSSHSVIDTTIAAGTTLGSVSVGGPTAPDAGLSGSRILAGVWMGSDGVLGGGNDAFNRAASIAAITVSGALSKTTIAAGLTPGLNGIFGDADDAAAPGSPVSKAIGKIVLGAINGAYGPAGGGGSSFAIEAASFASLTVGGVTTASNGIVSGSVIHPAGGNASDDIVVRIV